MEGVHENRTVKYRLVAEAVKENPDISDTEFEELLNRTILDGKTPVNEYREISN